MKAIEKMTTEEKAIAGYLESAAGDLKCAVSSGKAMKAAVFRFIADKAGLQGEERQRLSAEFLEGTPTWFGCNASQGIQALELGGTRKKAFDGFVA